MKWLSVFLLLSFLFCSGCDLRKREDELQKKETAINQKEQELLLKEKTLQLKETELMQRELKLDSVKNTDTVQKADSTHLYNPLLIGTWSVKMTCTETTCEGSAVGDTKTEQWNISYQGNTIIAKAMANDKLVRVYTGFFTGNTVELVEDRKIIPLQPATKMAVRLQVINEKSMDGQREIARDNECKVVYAIQARKQN